jgi:diacylglycerol kinase family enzyme
LAGNLGIPKDLEAAIAVALSGHRRKLDVGCVNGERFTVMAGCGFDALMIRDADRGLKDRFGRAAYVWSGARNLRASVVKARVKVDAETWFKGRLSCVLVGNVGRLFGGVEAFENASPDDGLLNLGIVTATNPVQWARTFGRTALGRADRSPFVRTTVARRIDVRLERKLPYELDGGARKATKRLHIEIEPGGISIAVPEAADS